MSNKNFALNFATFWSVLLVGIKLNESIEDFKANSVVEGSLFY